jgi:beta-N-acetylhexosaminidase
MAVKAFITGCAGTALTDTERRFFRNEDPWGLILFARNCVNKEQIRSLIEDFRACVGRADAAVLIDQEGGRVQRLRAPIWTDYPSAETIAGIHAHFPDAGRRAAWLLGRLIGEDLAEIGISVDCVPVLDIRLPATHKVIGDRSFGTDPDIIEILAGAMTDGLSAAGVAPIMKHIPGHGRATADSHFDLPVVDCPREELAITDFEPFRRFSTEPSAIPMAMTAHVVYSALDDTAPATLSPFVVNAIIRGEIGFDGLLMSDDLSMGALSGSLQERTKAAFTAGCDMALHCNGDLDEMAAVASQTPDLAGRAAERAIAALAWARREETDLAAAREEFFAILDRASRPGEA